MQAFPWWSIVSMARKPPNGAALGAARATRCGQRSGISLEIEIFNRPEYLPFEPKWLGVLKRRRTRARDWKGIGPRAGVGT